MSNRASAFRQSDVARVIRGAQAAGLTVASIEIDPNGKIVARFGEGATSASVNEWDEVLTDGQAKWAASKRQRV